MSLLRVSVVQSELHWQNPAANLAMFADKLAALKGQTDLVVLPEMFTTGFMMAPEVHAEPMEGESLAWMKAQAQALDAAIAGSVAIKTAAGFVNRFIMVTPQQDVHTYDKRHLFRMGTEHEHYCAGNERVIWHYKGWRILPAVCYDLRFPVFLRNRNDYDLALFVANWPGARRLPWRTLLQARAIENQCYVVGVNRVGTDGSGLTYTGDSLLVDYKGLCQIDHPQDEAFIETQTLELDALHQFRTVFPAWQDADTFSLQL